MSERELLEAGPGERGKPGVDRRKGEWKIQLVRGKTELKKSRAFDLAVIRMKVGLLEIEVFNRGGGAPLVANNLERRMGDYHTLARRTMEIILPEGHIIPPEGCIIPPEGRRRPQVEAARRRDNAARRRNTVA